MALLLGLTWLLYLPIGEHGFIWYDDGMYLLDNSQVNRGLSWEGLRWAFGEAHAGNWHPLTWLSHAFDCEWFGLQAGGHHLMGAGLHALNAALCFLALLAATGARWPSAFCAALFALHPLRVQSVAWASERKDLLAGLFFFLCLLAYVRYARRPSKANYAWVALCLVLGLLSKPMLVSLPLLLLCLDVWPLGRLQQVSLRRLLREKLPLLGLVLLSIGLTLYAQDQGGAFQFSASLPYLERIPHAASSVLWYLRSSFWPSDLALFYPHPGLANPHWNPWPASLVPFGLGIALLGFAKRFARCCPALPLGLCWMLLMLAPVIGLVQVGEQAWADRYAYLPTLGLYIAVAWPLAGLVRSHRAWRWPLGALAVLVLIGAGLRSSKELSYWKSSTSLARRALQVTERNHMAHIGLGLAQLEAGELDSAETEFEAARRIYPASTDVVLSLSKLYQASGRHEEAIELYTETLIKYPLWVTLRMRLGNALAQAGRSREAVAQLEQARELGEDHPGLDYNLALAYLQNQDPAAALPLLDASLSQSPKFFEARIARGEAHFQLRQYAAAKRDLLRGARIAPAQAAARLALLLASAPRRQLRDGAEALAWAQAAIQAQPSADSLEALAAAQAELGSFEEAQRTQAQALELLPERAQAQASQRLELYRAQRPYRLP